MEEGSTLDRRGELLKAVLLELKRLGGKAKASTIFEAVPSLLALTEWERERVKSGAVRWQVQVRFFSIPCVKAGWLQKNGGYWILTPEGDKALSKPGPQLIRDAVAHYREWKQARPDQETETENGDVPTTAAEVQAAYEDAVEQARTTIEEHVNNLGPYEFQKAAAELLMAMGYHVPYVAPPGRDGGIDIVAYSDPLGAQGPRIKVQVKHREQKVTVKEVRELEGLLRKDGDIGLIVSSGGFTGEVEREIRSSIKHIEMMDFDRFISLWQEHYEKLREQAKTLLPLVKVYFLAPVDE